MLDLSHLSTLPTSERDTRDVTLGTLAAHSNGCQVCWSIALFFSPWIGTVYDAVARHAYGQVTGGAKMFGKSK